MKRVTLYIGYCPGSGKRYFGKSSRYHTDEELQKNYWGSGHKWIKHYHEWGDPIMSVYWTGPESEVEKVALDFSYKNKIVTSQDWLNQIVETGSNTDTTGNVSYKSKTTGVYGMCSQTVFDNTPDYVGVNAGKTFSRTPSYLKKCIHCKKTGGAANMEKYHFDNCLLLTNKGFSEFIQCPNCNVRLKGKSANHRRALTVHIMSCYSDFNNTEYRNKCNEFKRRTK